MKLYAAFFFALLVLLVCKKGPAVHCPRTAGSGALGTRSR